MPLFHGACGVVYGLCGISVHFEGSKIAEGYVENVGTKVRRVHFTP